MGKKTPTALSLTRAHENRTGSIDPSLLKSTKPSRLRLWLSSLLIIGIVILGIVSLIAWNWLKNIHIPTPTNPSTTHTPITTLSVGRTVPYADLSFTVVNAQFAASFNDDGIRPEPAAVRLNLRVSNKTTYPVALIYYDIARLLAPGLKPIAPTNVHLSTGPKPGTSETGWLDFPIVHNIQLNTLKLQLGSTTLGEMLVTVPFSGPFDGSGYDSKLSPQSLTISYTFKGQLLIYHLNSVDIGYSYRGSQSKAGQQFYVLNFTVDNNNGVTVSPGFGYDYIRLVLDGNNRPPIDNTLPNDFKAGAQGVGGRVAYVAPAGLNTLTIAFLLQLVVGQQNYSVSL